MNWMQELQDEQWNPDYRLICKKHNYSVPPAANGIYFDAPCPRCEYEMEYNEPTSVEVARRDAHTLAEAMREDWEEERRRERFEIEEEKRRDWASDVDWAIE